jgi:hypothetical protein
LPALLGKKHDKSVFFASFLTDDFHLNRICCDPTQGTLDVRGMSGKVMPEFRRRSIIVHSTWLKSYYLLDPMEQGGLGLVRVTWRCIPENKESIGAALKCGYTYEGTMR